MSHDHDHGHTSNKKVLFWSFCLIFSFMVIEAAGGFLTNSLALLSDAGHMLSDAASLGLSLVAFKIGTKQANSSKTFGYRRMEIIAAFINGLALIAISLYIFYEAISRFFDPPDVSAGMMIIAVIGLIVNIAVAWMLSQGDSKENLNVRSAILHVLGDLLGSIGAIIAGILIYFFSWNIADPIASVVVAILVIVSGIRVTRDAFHVLMEGKPEDIDVDAIRESLVNFSEVERAHDLHVWSITSDFPSLSCHIVASKETDRDNLLASVQNVLKEDFDIHHSTIQIEGADTYAERECENDI